MKSNIAPIRKKYELFLSLLAGLFFVGVIPMLFCENLTGGFLIYFIIFVSTIVLGIITLCILFPIVRKHEIEFFKNKYSLENMEKNINSHLNPDDFIFYDYPYDFEITTNGIKNLLTGDERRYDEFQIYATQECYFAGEIYKIFINFEHQDEICSFQLDNTKYSILKLYNIKVENLHEILNDCEENLRAFFNSKTLKKEAIQKQRKRDIDELVNPILKLVGSKGKYHDFDLSITYHPNFVIRYDYPSQKFYINNKYYGFVEEAYLEEFIKEIHLDTFYIIEYKHKQLGGSYFKFIPKKKFKPNKFSSNKKVLQIFDINRTLNF